jgi:hypothetical protein
MSRDTDRTEELRAEFVDALVQELGLREVMALPIANSLVAYLQRQYPGERLYIPAPPRQYDVLQIEAALRSGTSINRVCREHGVARSTLYRIFPGGLPTPDDEAAA